MSGPTDTDETQPTVDEFSQRVFKAILGAQEVQAIYLGDKLGWYRALAEHGPLNSTELAERTSCNERYAREWLEHQAAVAYLSVDDATAASDKRRYTLPPAQAEVLANADSLAYYAPFATLTAALGGRIDRVAGAYKSGGGVSWDEFGDDARIAQGAANRPMYLQMLGQQMFPQYKPLHDLLSAGGRVAEVGCGAGWACIGIAGAYPSVTVDGFDIDKPSVDMALRNVADHGMSDRVNVTAADGASVAGSEYDAVFAFECVHDMADPVSVLKAMRVMAKNDGMVVVMDELADEQFNAPASDVERLLYGYSITCCLPDSMSTSPSRATGTVMRPSALEGYAKEAGFAGIEILPIESDLFRFYRLATA